MLNGELGNRFPVAAGVQERDSLSPLLFACFINDLGQAMNTINFGLKFNDKCMNLFMYADDIVLTSRDVISSQKQLDLMASWCKDWGMYI